MAKQNEKQSQIADRGAGNWGKVMSEAKPTQQLYPKLFFGAENVKEARGIVELLIMHDEPRSIMGENPYKDNEESESFVFDVEVISSTFPENVERATRALFLPGDPNHGLTRGVTEIARKHKNKLRGVALKIEVAPYKNKKYRTTTRGYTVTEIPAPGSGTPP